MYDIFHLKLFKYWVLEWRGTPSLPTRQNVFLPNFESAPVEWRFIATKLLFSHKYKFLLCLSPLNWKGLQLLSTIPSLNIRSSEREEWSDLYNELFLRLSSRYYLFSFTVLQLYSNLVRYYQRLEMNMNDKRVGPSVIKYFWDWKLCCRDKSK
jgi:hypothetical protein